MTAFWRVFLTFVLIALMVILIWIFSGGSGGEYFRPAAKRIESTKISVGKTTVEAEIVSSPKELEKGLSGREKMEESEGMLFTFPAVGHHGIWMKNMRFPIDILWINENLEVVDFKEDVLLQTYPEVFYPGEESLYVLETVAGFVKKSGVKIGEKVKIFKME